MTMAAWWHPVAFGAFGVFALSMGALRYRGASPIRRRASSGADTFDTPACGPASIWHAGVLRAIDAASFAALCEAMFTQDGERTAPSPPPSADFLVHRPDDRPPLRRLVRCIAAGAAPANEHTLRGFAAAIATAHADAGIFITAGPTDRASIAIAREHAITLVDGPALLRLIVQRSVRQQRALRSVPSPAIGAVIPRCRLEPTPPSTWFAAAIAGFVAAVISWPAPGAPAPLEAADDAPARLATTRPFSERPDAEPPRSSQPRAEPATVADLDPSPETPAPPAAGRQVLRCTAGTRVTYLAADAICPEGHGERVTVFPTEGINPFR